jgi:uncharacterized membrane protein YebE (DUF533 family)
MQSGLSSSSSDRIAHGMGPQGVGGAGSPLGDLIAGMLGKAGGASGGVGGGGLGDLLGRMTSGAGGSGGGLSDVLGQGGGGLAGGLGGLAGQAETMLRGPGGKDALAMGGLASLAGAVLGGRRAGMGGAIGGGLLALLGSLAFSALKNRGAGGAPASEAELAREAPLGLREPQTPAEEEELQNTAQLAIRAMIDAAKADGAIDGGEMSRIMGKLKELGTDDDARDFVMNELQKPLDMDGLVSSVHSPEVAVQVYSASLLAIEIDTPAEKEYLQKLAQGLGLDAATVGRIHQALGLSPT